MKQMIWISLAISLMACSADKKPGNSPFFEDEDILSIAGTFQEKDGEGLGNRNIALRNIRRFPYYDPTATYVRDAISWFFQLAFPMFPVYEGSYVQQKVKSNYFLKEVKTAIDGSFQFQMRGKDVLRDSEGGINIVLINDGQGTTDSFAKYSFVIKSKTTDLGSIKLCALNEQRQELADELSFSWTLPGYTLDHYEFRFADARDNSLLWVSRVDAAATSLTLPKSIFQTDSIRYAVEIFYTFEDELQTSCLTASQSFQLASPKSNLAAGRPVVAENIAFRVTSLTNGRFNDPSYFAAYDTRSLVVNLGQNTLIQSVNLHNLQFTSDASAKLSIEGATAEDPTAFISLGLDQVDALRFASYTLPVAGSWARVRISSPGIISNLQEIAIQ